MCLELRPYTLAGPRIYKIVKAVAGAVAVTEKRGALQAIGIFANERPSHLLFNALSL